MTDALRSAQDAGLLQFALSPWRGRKTASSDSGEVAIAGGRSLNVHDLAQGDFAGSVSIGAATERVGKFGSEAQGNAVQRFQGGSTATWHWHQVRPRNAGQVRANLSAGVDGESGRDRKGSGVGRVGGSLPDLESTALSNFESRGRRIVAGSHQTDLIL